MTDTDDARRCSAGRGCQGYEVTEGRRLPALIADPPGMCEPCERAIAAALRALPGQWRKLELTLGESRAPVAGGRRPKPGSRVPINTNTDELMGQIAAACDDAGRIVAAALHTQWRPLNRARRTVRHEHSVIVAAAELVAPNVPALLDGGLGLGVARRIMHLHRRARHQLGETRQRERQHLPCPSCGAQALVREVQDRRRTTSAGDGSATPEVIRCLACNGGPNRDGTWTETEYTWLAHMVLAEREEIAVLKWLLAEAQHERDVAAWLAAERDWALDRLAADLHLMDGYHLLERVRAAVVPAERVRPEAVPA
ncbi:DNA binding protein [Mycobacterium phage DS6A]|uniref:Uncharacterized protein n=1 Tax=Mycobacterium phage DS6A TaxID=45764 RepID=G8I4J9_9CAUD|nr:DNA binding protein [Mycobacterium phage DS6A]AER47643.1 hypothetical protein DS6A_89 [Mycobacterium phage DS6A]